MCSADGAGLRLRRGAKFKLSADGHRLSQPQHVRSNQWTGNHMHHGASFDVGRCLVHRNPQYWHCFSMPASMRCRSRNGVSPFVVIQRFKIFCWPRPVYAFVVMLVILQRLNRGAPMYFGIPGCEPDGKPDSKGLGRNKTGWSLNRNANFDGA